MAYIPEAHKKYNLFRDFVETGDEFILYPDELTFDIAERMPDDVNFSPCNDESSHMYGCYSYDEYYGILDNIIATLGTDDEKMNELGEMLTDFKREVQRMNIKENWSVLKFIGESSSYDDLMQFEHGRYYYMACSHDPLQYLGIIDDDYVPHYTATDPSDYLKPDTALNASDWEIAEDTTGIATQILNNAFANGQTQSVKNKAFVSAEDVRIDRAKGNCSVFRDNEIEFLAAEMDAETAEIALVLTKGDTKGIQRFIVSILNEEREYKENGDSRYNPNRYEMAEGILVGILSQLNL